MTTTTAFLATQQVISTGPFYKWLVPLEDGGGWGCTCIVPDSTLRNSCISVGTFGVNYISSMTAINCEYVASELFLLLQWWSSRSVTGVNGSVQHVKPLNRSYWPGASAKWFSSLNVCEMFYWVSSKWNAVSEFEFPTVRSYTSRTSLAFIVKGQKGSSGSDDL